MFKLTIRQYEFAWKKWFLCCQSREINPCCATLPKIVNYLSYLFDTGVSYSVINTHKSMIVQTLSLLGSSDLVQNPVLSRFMKGIFHMKPPKPRYTFTWDVYLGRCSVAALSSKFKTIGGFVFGNSVIQNVCSFSIVYSPESSNSC